MTAVVIGASAGVGRALSEALAAHGHRLVLVASDKEDLDALARHLRTVHRVEVRTLAVDAADICTCTSLVAEVAAYYDDIDQLFFPIGASRADDRALLDPREILVLLNSNLSVVIALTAHFLPQLQKRSRARIVGFSSIAAVRGRSANVVYSAAKRGLESYFESLRHLSAGSNVTVQLIRLGYVDSQQSFGQRLLFPAVPPERVADHVMQTGHRDFGVHYFPKFWKFIGLMVAGLPWLIYKKARF